MQLPNQKKIVLLTITIYLLFLNISELYAAEQPDSVNKGSKIENNAEQDSGWIAEADRLIRELLDLDVRMFTLINSVGNTDSRKALIRQRSINRKLIYDLTMAINQASSEPGGQ